jgi:HD-GYP domain-containing protein (c-di-GMP phosphodiesterase class II)
MAEVFLGKDNACIEKVEKITEELSLLAKSDGVEIMHQKIQQNVLFHIDPGDDESLMEFFYILNGLVAYEKDCKEVILKAGEYFYVRGIKEAKYFRTITEVSLLYVASQPVFHFLSEEIKKLTEMRLKVEEKDMYTHDHGLRLQDYSFRIGEKLHLSKDELSILSYAAIFHDLGKINVIDEILKKPAKLTDEEFEYIKKHPADGEALIKNTFLKESALAILQHHERLDGSGYPNGLKDDEICLEAKIIAVVDTYDAMTSDRPYRKGIDNKVAFDEIRSLIGRHYDEKIVNCFEEILQEEGIL